MREAAYGIRLKTGRAIYFTDSGEVIDWRCAGQDNRGESTVTAKDGRVFRLEDWSPRAGTGGTMMDEVLDLLNRAIRQARQNLDHAIREAEDADRIAAEQRELAARLAKRLAECEAAIRVLSSQSITIQNGGR